MKLIILKTKYIFTIYCSCTLTINSDSELSTILQKFKHKHSMGHKIVLIPSFCVQILAHSCSVTNSYTYFIYAYLFVHKIMLISAILQDHNFSGKQLENFAYLSLDFFCFVILSTLKEFFIIIKSF